MTNLNGSSVLKHIFLAFKSYKDIFYIIYSNIERNILLYDLKINKLIAQIKNAHNNAINCFRHHYDRKNKRDLILSLSLADKNIKIWDLIFNCIFDVNNIYMIMENYIVHAFCKMIMMIFI